MYRARFDVDLTLCNDPTPVLHAACKHRNTLLNQRPGPKPTPPGPIIPKLLAHLTLLALVSRSSSRFLIDALLDLPHFRHPTLQTRRLAYLFPQESAFFPSGGYCLPATSILGSQVHHSCWGYMSRTSGISEVSPPNHVAPSEEDGQKYIRSARGRTEGREADGQAYGNLGMLISCLYS